MAPLLDMHTQTVYSSGKAVTGLTGDASTAGRGFLESLTNAQTTVVHHIVAGALEKYHGTWSGARCRGSRQQHLGLGC